MKELLNGPAVIACSGPELTGSLDPSTNREWVYWLMDAATRCSTARDSFGRDSDQARAAEARLVQVRSAIHAYFRKPEQMKLEVAA